MENKKLLLGIALLIIIGVLIYASTYYKNKTAETSNPANTEVVDPNPASMVGIWEVGGNDFMYTEFNLLATGEFKEKTYSPANPKEIFNGAGTWKIIDEEGTKYLHLTYDQNINPPKNEQMLEQYREWGQEFIGDNQTLLKISTDQYVGTSFRYHGNLISKTDTYE
jgi:hypothetical protein